MAQNRDVLDAGSRKQLSLRLTHGQDGGAASRQTELVVDQSSAVSFGERLAKETPPSGLPERIDSLGVVHTGSAELREIGTNGRFHPSHVVWAAHDDKMMMSP